jgi:glucosyl-3-phosphoglycerate synthase
MSELAPPLAGLRSVVVVPARDEESRIASCLRALAEQSGVEPSSYEVIVVLDGCRDATLAAVERAAIHQPLPPVHAVVLEHHQGVGRARRLGMDLAYERLLAVGAENGLIASTDADTVVAADWLAAQLELAGNGAEAIGGLIELDAAETEGLHPDALVAREHRARQRIAAVREGAQNHAAAEHPHFSGASMALTAAAYRRCGGLPVRAALEDEALANALGQQGITIHRSSRVRVRTSARVNGRAPRGLAHDLARVDWRARRSYQSDRFPLERLLAAKRDTVALILPARNVEETVGEIATIAMRLTDAGLLDEVLVVDGASQDATVAVAQRAGVTVVQENELMAEHGQSCGKGDAMWRGLAATSGEIVAFADTDSEDFTENYLLGILGPLICDPGVQLVKGAFRRPFRSGETVHESGGGRVTELMARPLLNLHTPELAVFDQPLAGETAARRSLLERIPFSAGYGVEIGMLIDCWRLVGLDALAQVDLGSRQNRHQPLRELSAMAYAVLVAAQARVLGADFADASACASMALPPIGASGGMMETRAVSVTERPALSALKRPLVRR